jgi:hypothetical protein
MRNPWISIAALPSTYRGGGGTSVPRMLKGQDGLCPSFTVG